MHLNDFWNILKKNSQVNFLQGYASYESVAIKSIITKMVMSTDVAHHFQNMDVLKQMTPKNNLDEKDSMVLFVLCSLWSSSCFMLVILGILAWILVIISVGALWLVFSLTRLPGRRRSWGWRSLAF